MTYKEQFLTDLRKKYPLVTTEDQLYECAIKSYRKEHEFAKKSREEADVFARNLQKHPEMVYLMSAFFDPNQETSITNAVETMKLDVFRVYKMQIEKDHSACAEHIKSEMFQRVIDRINEQVDRSCLYNNDEYPDDYTTFDCIIADSHNNLSYEEIAPGLSKIISNLIETEFSTLSAAEKLVIGYTHIAYENNELHFDSLDRIYLLLSRSFSSLISHSEVKSRMIKKPKPDDDKDKGKDKKQIGTIITYEEDDSDTELRGYAAVAGLQDLKKRLKSDIVDIIRKPERAKALKLPLPNGILLYGPPGCGKTYFAQKLAEEMKCSFMSVDCSDLATPYIHGAQGDIGDMFKEAEKIAPCILFLDEVDALIARRDKHHNVHTSGEVNVFLTHLNGCGKKGIVVIGATNRPQDIDPAALRSGRLENKYYFPLPDVETRKRIFAIHLHGVPTKDEISLTELADLTDNYASSDLEKIVLDAKRIAHERELDYLDMSMLEEAVKRNSPSVTKSDLREYEAIRDKFEGRKPEYQRIGFC